MKWSEMSVFHKVVYVIGIICAVAFWVLSGLRIWLDVASSRILEYALFGIFWLSLGIVQKDKKLAIWNYVLAAGYFLFSLLSIFI